MDFKQKKRSKRNNEEDYHIENLKIVREFSKKLLTEMNSLVKAIVLFGSNTKNTSHKDSDIDLMIVLDNVSVFVTPELREAYRVIVQNLSKNTSNKLHILTVNFSEFWDMARKGDPVFINILRYGVPIYDTNLIDPMQYLLNIGKIRPSLEAFNNYTSRAYTLLNESNKHIEDAIFDIYYSVIDIVHATLILSKQMPPSPKEMPQLFKKTFKGTSIEKHYTLIDKLYKISKKLENKKIKINGTFYDELKQQSDKLLLDLNSYNKSILKKKDIFNN